MRPARSDGKLAPFAAILGIMALVVTTAAARGGGRRPVFTRDCLQTKLGHRERRSRAARRDRDRATTPLHASLALQRSPRKSEVQTDDFQ